MYLYYSYSKVAVMSKGGPFKIKKTVNRKIISSHLNYREIEENEIKVSKCNQTVIVVKNAFVDTKSAIALYVCQCMCSGYRDASIAMSVDVRGSASEKRKKP